MIPYLQSKQKSRPQSGVSQKYIYAASQAQQILCGICGKSILKRTLKRHIASQHAVNIELEEQKLVEALGEERDKKLKGQQILEPIIPRDEKNQNVKTAKIVAQIQEIDKSDVFNFPEKSWEFKQLHLKVKPHWKILSTIKPLHDVPIPARPVCLQHQLLARGEILQGKHFEYLTLDMKLFPDQTYVLKSLVYSQTMLSLLNTRIKEQSLKFVNPKVIGLMQEKRRSIFESYLNSQLEKCVNNTFAAYLDEVNPDCAEALENLRTNEKIDIDIFYFLGCSKIHSKTHIHQKPGTYRERHRKGLLPYQPSLKQIQNVRSLFEQGWYIAMVFQRIVNHFMSFSYKSTSFQHQCLITYLKQWLNENKSLRVYHIKTSKGEELLAITKRFENLICHLLHPKTKIHKGTIQYLRSQVSKKASQCKTQPQNLLQPQLQLRMARLSMPSKWEL